VLFPKVPDSSRRTLELKLTTLTELCCVPFEAMIKDKHPDSIVCTDVALDPYSDQGHNGVVEDGKILNDVTINQLCKQAMCQARAGANVVAPSGMADGTFHQFLSMTSNTANCDSHLLFTYCSLEWSRLGLRRLY